MERTRQIARGSGKITLALLGGILFPILIWVALGVVINQRIQEGRLQRKPTPTIGEILAAAGLTIQAETATSETVAAEVFTQPPVSEISQLLARAGLTIHEEAVPKPYAELMYYPLALSRQIIPARVRAIKV